MCSSTLRTACFPLLGYLPFLLLILGRKPHLPSQSLPYDSQKQRLLWARVGICGGPGGPEDLSTGTRSLLCSQHLLWA